MSSFRPNQWRRPQRRLGVPALLWAAGLGLFSVIGGVSYLDNGSRIEDGPPYVDIDDEPTTLHALEEERETGLQMMFVFGAAALVTGGFGAWRLVRGGIWEQVSASAEPLPGGQVTVADIMARIEGEHLGYREVAVDPISFRGTPLVDVMRRLDRQHRAYAGLVDSMTDYPEQISRTEDAAYSRLREDASRLVLIHRATTADPATRPSPTTLATIDSLTAELEAGVAAHDALLLATSELYTELAAADRATRSVSMRDELGEVQARAAALRVTTGITERVLGTDTP